MKTEKKIPVRVYTVRIRDERTGEKSLDTIVIEKAMLQAGAVVGLGDEDIICRIYNRKGYRVADICEVVKAEIIVDLLFAYNAVAGLEQAAQAEGRSDNGGA